MEKVKMEIVISKIFDRFASRKNCKHIAVCIDIKKVAENVLPKNYPK